MAIDNLHQSTEFDKIFDSYIKSNDINIQDGMTNEGISRLQSGDTFKSQFNKLFLIKLENLHPSDGENYAKNRHLFEPKTFTDLCKIENSQGSSLYEVEDFMYCKKIHYPINRLITLRRFAKPTIDNIFSDFGQGDPDIGRMVTFFDQTTNKLEDLLQFTYGLKWRELESSFETASMIGDQAGFSGHIKSIMKYIDPTLANNSLRGENQLSYDPLHDQNKIWGPVDSINKTNYRDVGLEMDKTFNIVFEYDLLSYSGVTPEYAMKDIIGNILSVTYNDARFWGGARYYVGERPSQYLKNFNWTNPKQIDNFIEKAYGDLKGFVGSFVDKSGGKINAVKQVLKNGFAVGIGKILDSLGRASIPVMNSLLSGEPTGNWHLTIGNPMNPILCIGNLLLDNVELTFPTDSLSYGDFPTKLRVNVTLKNGMPKDRAGMEMMFNIGKSRIYYPMKTVSTRNSGLKSNGNKNTGTIINSVVDFSGQITEGTYSFISEKIKTITGQTATEHINKQIKVADGVVLGGGASREIKKTGTEINKQIKDFGKDKKIT